LLSCNDSQTHWIFSSESQIQTRLRNLERHFSQPSDEIMNMLSEIENARTLDILSLNIDKNKAKELELKYYQLLGFPLQGVCRVLKRIGGLWNRRQVDGDKFICLDNFDKMANKDCYIYTFGISNDWTFEDIMDKVGCKIFSYDHTVDFPSTRGKNIHFKKIGLGDGEHLQSLTNIIAANGHQNTTIEYLKIDIEGYEFSDAGLRDWLDSGALDNVNQIALELHHKDNPQQIPFYLQLLQDLYKAGFRQISQEVNMVMGLGPRGLYYNLVEVVFMKV